VGLFDVDEVAGVVEDLEPALWWQVRFDVLGEGAPTHLFGLQPEDGEQRHAEARQPVHRPLGPPGAEAAESQRRVDLPAPPVGIATATDGDEVAEPLVWQPGVHPGAPPGELVDGAGLAPPAGGPPPEVQPAGDLAGEELGALVV